MLALFSKSWKCSVRTPLPPCPGLFPQFKPGFSIQVAHVPNRFYSSPPGEKLDKATLSKFKRVVALREEFERRDGYDMLHDWNRWTSKTAIDLIHDRKHNGTSITRMMTNVWTTKLWETGQMYLEYEGILVEMFQIEYRKKLKKEEEAECRSSVMKQVLADSANLRLGQPSRVRIVSRFEALLEADAALQRPMLNSQERGTVRDVLREYLESQRRSDRFQWGGVLVTVYVLFWVHHTWDDDAE